MNPAILMLALPMVLVIVLMFTSMFGREHKDESEIEEELVQVIGRRLKD